MCNVEDFLTVLAVNRRRHGTAWKKVRADRLAKLVADECHDHVLTEAISQGAIRLCQKEVPTQDGKGTMLVDAVQLSGREYMARLRARLE